MKLASIGSKLIQEDAKMGTKRFLKHSQRSIKMTKTRTATLGLAIAACIGAPTYGEVVASEFFNGYGSTNLTMENIPDNGGFGWDDQWGDSVGTERNGYDAGASLSYSAVGYDNSANLSGSTDGAVSYLFPGVSGDGSTPVSARTFSTTATTLWYSVLVRLDGDPATGHAILWIGDTAGGNLKNFVGILSGNFMMRYDGTNATATPTAAAVDTTYLILAKAELNVSGVNDRLSMWVNPDLSGGEGTLGAAYLVKDDANVVTFDGIAIQTLDDGQIDAIRVGTTLSDVTTIPEPGSLALLGLGGLLIASRRRRD